MALDASFNFLVDPCLLGHFYQVWFCLKACAIGSTGIFFPLELFGISDFGNNVIWLTVNVLELWTMTAIVISCFLIDIYYLCFFGNILIRKCFTFSIRQTIFMYRANRRQPTEAPWLIARIAQNHDGQGWNHEVFMVLPLPWWFCSDFIVLPPACHVSGQSAQSNRGVSVGC